MLASVFFWAKAGVVVGRHGGTTHVSALEFGDACISKVGDGECAGAFDVRGEHGVRGSHDDR